MSYLVDVVYHDQEWGEPDHEFYGPFNKAVLANRYADSIELRIRLAQLEAIGRTVTIAVRPIHKQRIMPVVHEARAFLHGELTPKEEA